MTDRSLSETKTRFRRNGHNGNAPITNATKEVVKKNGNGNGHKKNGNGKNGKNGNGNGTLVLTPSEKIFADEWLIDRNGTRAYKVAYPYIKNDQSAAVAASMLLRKFKVDKYINKRLAKLSATAEMDVEWVLKRYKMLVDYSIDDFFNDDGSMKSFSEIPKDKLYAIGGFKQTKKTITDKDEVTITNRIKEFKLSDKKGVLDSVSKYLKMFDADEEKQGNKNFNFNGPVQINVSLADENEQSSD